MGEVVVSLINYLYLDNSKRIAKSIHVSMDHAQ